VSFLSRIASVASGFIRRSVATQLFVRGEDLDGNGTASSLSRPYEKSVWVQRAIKEVSGPIAAVELKFYEGDREITSAPWLDFWRKPVANLSQSDFIEAITGWLKLAGEAFIVLPTEFSGKFLEVKPKLPPLRLIRPDCMKHVVQEGKLVQWEFRSGRQQETFLPEQVIQPKYWNPYDDFRGMSEYEAARVATEGDYLSGKFALNLARANGDTGLIIGIKGGGLPNDDQQRQIREQLKLKALRSHRGDFSSMFLPADLEVQDPKVRAPDAQFVAQRLANRHEIYIAFGVPPSMADVVASYSVGSASDWYRLITGACMPTAAKIEDAISQVASRMHGREVEAYFEFDDHPVMQQVRSERIDAGTKLWDRGMPWKDASDYLDLDLPRFKGDDQGFISFGLAPVGDDGKPEENQPETDPNLAEAEEEAEADPIQEAVRALRSGSSSSSSSSSNCDCCTLDFSQLAIKANDSKHAKLWKSLVAKRRETIRAYESKFNAVLMTARREVLRKLERAELLESASMQSKAEAQSGLAARAAAADFMFNLPNFEKLFKVQMRNTGMNALQTAGDQLLKELGKDDPWKMPQAETIEFLRQRENRLAGVPDDVFERIKGTIEEGITNGDSLKQIANAVRGEFNDLGDKRASVIASTETAAAYGTGRQLAMEEAGIQFKQWLTSNNDNVRAAHRAMNGATVPIDEQFTVINPKTGEVDKIDHPADPTGAPWNVINCHCVQIAVASGPEGEAEPAT